MKMRAMCQAANIEVSKQRECGTRDIVYVRRKLTLVRQPTLAVW